MRQCARMTATSASSRCAAHAQAFAPPKRHWSRPNAARMANGQPRQPRRSRSWRTSRAEDHDRNRTPVGGIDCIEAQLLGIAQPDRLGALREIAFLADLDEGEPAFTAAQEFGGTGGISEPHRSADEKDEARLLIADGGHQRLAAWARADQAGESRARI